MANDALKNAELHRIAEAVARDYIAGGCTTEELRNGVAFTKQFTIAEEIGQPYTAIKMKDTFPTPVSGPARLSRREPDIAPLPPSFTGDVIINPLPVIAGMDLGAVENSVIAHIVQQGGVRELIDMEVIRPGNMGAYAAGTSTISNLPTEEQLESARERFIAQFPNMARFAQGLNVRVVADDNVPKDEVHLVQGGKVSAKLKLGAKEEKGPRRLLDLED